MRKTIVILVCALSTAAQAKHPLTDRYLDGLFRAKPHLATFMGVHEYDGKLPDLSPEALKKREKELVALDGEVQKTPGKTLDDRIDARILRDGIALELLYLREIRDWEWDPRLYDSFPYYDPREIVAGRLSDIIHGDFAPEAQRRASVVAQLTALPRYLAEEQAAVEHGKRKPSRVYLDQAVKDGKGRIEFFESEVKAFAQKPDAYARAKGALEKYQAFLEGPAQKLATGDWRLGKELYAKKFPLALQTTLTPQEVIPRAEASFKQAREGLYAVARKLYAQLWPKLALPSASADNATQAKVISMVKDELSKDHPKPDELVQAHARNLDELRAFIEKHDLLELPPKDTLLVEPMPAFKRGSTAAEYLAPGVLDKQPTWHATYYVDPIDPTWPKERVESYLRGQNNYEVQLVASHEAYPGHHTQYFYSKRNLNPLRAVLWNAPMVEGWAVYGEGLMVKLGWGALKNDAFRFFDLRGQMVVATNVLLDIKLQSGQISDEEAVRFMVEEGFQEKAMAEKKLLRAKLDSTQLAQYYLGWDEINALERDYRKKVGPKFTQRGFNEALIGQGSIAVKFLRAYLLDEQP